MGRQIVIMPKAEIELEKITDYIVAEFGSNVKQRFITRFREVRNIISETPEIYPITNSKRRIRKCVLSKKCNVYFRVYRNRIEILSVFDTRQNPDKLKSFI